MARWAEVVQTFWPLTTHLLPFSSAFVMAPARSEPEPGSLRRRRGAAAPARPRRPDHDVEQLDLTAIELAIQSKDPRGERPYSPRMMVALLLYGYAVGVFSSPLLWRY